MALAEEESSSARADADLVKAEVESVREALSRTIEDFQSSKEFKEEILEDDFTSYYVGYEDGRDAVEKLYPNLDLSSIVLPRSKDGVAEEEAPTQDEAPTMPEVIQITDATPEQRNVNGDEA